MFFTKQHSEKSSPSVPLQKAVSQPFFQPKLIVNLPDDTYKQKAARVGDQAMRMREGDTPIVQRMSLTPVSRIMRKCAECENEEKEDVQRKEGSGGDLGGKAAPSVVSDVLSSGGGQPIDGDTRQFMESRFGQDFSQVRIHTGKRAAESAQAIQARAYTSGRDVVFGKEEYQPGSESGRRLLAHELAHTMQQSSGSNDTHTGTIQRFQMNPDQIKAFPKMANFVSTQLPKIVNFKHLIKAMNKAGKNVGAKAKDFTKDISWGMGPTLEVKPLRKGNSGKFHLGTSLIDIQETDFGDTDLYSVERYEKDPNEIVELWLETVILHEYVHYLYDGKKPRPENSEEGHYFEELAYGNANPSFERTVQPQFRSGTWEISVVSIGSTKPQRFTVKGATQGDNTYELAVGKKIKVLKDPTDYSYWKIQIESHDVTAKKWSLSKMRKQVEWVRIGQGLMEGATIWSDDDNDRDLDDYVLRVRPISKNIRKAKSKP